MGRPSKRVSRKRKPTTLRNVSPFSKSISVPGGTSGARIFGSTTKLSMARYRQLAVRKGLTQLRTQSGFGNRFEQFLFGGFLPAFLTRGDTEIVVRSRALRIEAEGFC